MQSKNSRHTAYLTQDLVEEIQRYAATGHITMNEAMRQLIRRGLSLHTISEEQDTVRKYIREEIETVLPIAIKPFMERLIKMQANATRTSAAALMSTISVISENYIDTISTEEILANALKLATRITKSKPKSDSEYLSEAREWINADLGKPNDT